MNILDLFTGIGAFSSAAKSIDGYTEGFSDAVRYSMLGNSIAYPVAEWIFERIKAVDVELLASREAA
jgi:site-specific DNA-cytosine methylase